VVRQYCERPNNFRFWPIASLPERIGTAATVKVFGCRPHEGGAARTGPAYANLQGRCYAADGGGEEGEDMAFIGADVNRWSTPCRS